MKRQSVYIGTKLFASWIKIGPSGFVIILGKTNNKSYTSKSPKKVEDNRDFFR